VPGSSRNSSNGTPFCENWGVAPETNQPEALTLPSAPCGSGSGFGNPSKFSVSPILVSTRTVPCDGSLGSMSRFSEAQFPAP